MADDVRAAVKIWQGLGARISAVTGAASNTAVSFTSQGAPWEGEYLPTQRAIEVNTAKAGTSEQRVRVLVHELGHALGLSDGSTPYMQGNVAAPTKTDIAAINALPLCGPAKTAPEYLCPLRHADGGCVGGSIVGGDKAIPEVSVPPEYVYDPECKDARFAQSGASCFGYSVKHDYCSLSPDQFPSYGANADFRGPCARHDMCLDGFGPPLTGMKLWNACNSALLSNMQQNCRRTYGLADPRLGECMKTANMYWVAVTSNAMYDVMVGAPK